MCTYYCDYLVNGRQMVGHLSDAVGIHQMKTYDRGQELFITMISTTW